MGHEGGSEEHHNPAMMALEGGHVGDSLFSLAEGGGLWHMAEHAAHGTAAAGMMEGVAPFMAGFGGVLGGFNMGKGIGEVWNAVEDGNVTGSEGSQGVLDIASGGLGVASAGMALAGAACPPLAIAAGLAGLGSFGNEWAEGHGLYGQHMNDETGQMENATFLNSIGDTAQGGWGLGHDIFGQGIAGDIAGGVAGGVGAAGQTVWNGAMAVGGGLARAGEAIWSFLSDERFKQDVAPITGALDLLDRL